MLAVCSVKLFEPFSTSVGELTVGGIARGSRTRQTPIRGGGAGGER